jgi:hypothetical protein
MVRALGGNRSWELGTSSLIKETPDISLSLSLCEDEVRRWEIGPHHTICQHLDLDFLV